MTATPSNLLAARYDACSRPAEPLPPESDAERMSHIEHIADHGSPIPSIEALWLIDQLKAATTERDALRELVSQCADSIARASENIDAVMAATDISAEDDAVIDAAIDAAFDAFDADHTIERKAP